MGKARTYILYDCTKPKHYPAKKSGDTTVMLNSKQQQSNE